jgi:hypothetical protein
LTKRPAIPILTFAPKHFLKLVRFAETRKLEEIDSYLIFEEDRRSKTKMKKAIALSSILLLAVVAYGCQGGCGPAPANNTANNTNANRTPTPAATPATTPASTNTNTGNANANANKANTSPTKTP